MIRTRSPAILATGVGALALLAFASGLGKRPVLFWNVTASVPRGLYIARGGGAASVGDMVAAWLPDPVRGLAAERHYLPTNVPMIKPVIATAGSTVCAAGDAITIDGRTVASRLGTDSQGRPLPRWFGCQTLQSADVFVLSNHAPDSFDGRYFGPISRQQIIAKVRPVWTY